MSENRNAPPAGVLRSLNEAMAAAPAIRELAWAHGTIVAAAARRGTAGERVAALLAEATADLLADPEIGKVRECAGDNCVLLFLPGHPPPPVVLGHALRKSRPRGPLLQPPQT